MKITTRAASPKEKAAIQLLYEQAMRRYIEVIWGWDQSWQDNNFDNAFQVSLTYVIEKDSTLLGYFQIDQGESQDSLRMLILEPLARSAGIGARLLSKIVKVAHENGKGLMLRVFKLNVGAKRFYEREGWVVLAEEDAFFLMGHSSNPNLTADLPNKSQRTTKSYTFVVR